MSYTFNFPKNKRAAEATLDEQLLKCSEELHEVMCARFELDDKETLAELMDLACSVENAIRKFSYPSIECEHRLCVAKGKERSDW